MHYRMDAQRSPRRVQDNGSPLIVTDAAERGRLVVIQRSGLFDGAWMVGRNPDLPQDTHGALIHWHRHGWRENRWPNPYFDTGYYRSRVQDAAERDPLLHYIQGGEAAGQRPVPFFDPVWYRDTYAVPPDQLCLAHFLRRRFSGQVSPIPEFDSGYYLRANPDVAAAGMDPLEHYLVQGFREDRLPTPGFDLRRHRRSRLNQTNPLLDLLMARERRGPASTTGDVATEVRRTTTPHPAFEEAAPLPPGEFTEASYDDSVLTGVPNELVIAIAVSDCADPPFPGDEIGAGVPEPPPLQAVTSRSAAIAEAARACIMRCSFLFRNEYR